MSESMIKLACPVCNKNFEMTNSNYKRRIWKLPDSKFYCSRACSPKQHLVKYQGCGILNPQHGNTYGQKYDPQFAWYISRCVKDSRFEKMQDPLEFEKHIIHLWQMQNGKCALTGIPLTLRKKYLKQIDKYNPFFVASLDRKDNSIAYKLGNVQWVSMAINFARNKCQLDEFKTYFDEFKNTLNW